MNRYEQGQVLVHKTAKGKVKVLGVCGEVVHLSHPGNFEEYGYVDHYKDIERIYDIVEEDWKPNDYETFYFINHYGVVCDDEWTDHPSCHFRLKTKNAFRTREQAEARLRELPEGE